MVKATHPVVVEELTPAPLTLGEIQRCLQSLLTSGCASATWCGSSRPVDPGPGERDPDGLVEAARGALGPAISAAHATDGRLPVLTLDPILEQTLLEVLRRSGSFLAIDPTRAEAIATDAAVKAEQAEQRGDSPVLVCSPRLRLPLRKLVQISAPRLPVLSYQELGPQLELDTVGVVNLANAPVGG